MTLLDPQPILVAASGSRDDLMRRGLVRTACCDVIEHRPPFAELLRQWRDSDIRSIAERAHDAFETYVDASGLPTEDIDFALGGRLVGRVMRGQHVLDEPTPPEDQTLQVGAFVDRLLAGEATTGDLAELFAEAATKAHVDLRSPRPLGTMDRAVAIDWTPEGRRQRAPLEALVTELDQLWGTTSDRRAEALAFLGTIGFDRWPSLAEDLVERYRATMRGIVRGETPHWEYQLGDPAEVGDEPPNLAIPGFLPSGNAATDRQRIARWRARVNQVASEINAAAEGRRRTHAKTRPVRDDERAAFRRNAEWLYQQAAEGRSLVTIAVADLGSRDRWRDVQRAIRRMRQLLDIGASPP